MPIILLDPKKKIAPVFNYPESGKIRLSLEANSPVDVFIVKDKETEQKIKSTPEMIGNSVKDLPGVWGMVNQTNINTIINLPELWKPTGWCLVIGNPDNTSKAVYYQVSSILK